MAYFVWKEEYSVGVREIDNQHKKLVSMINDLYESMKDGKGREVLEETITGLYLYTKTHFSFEESLMKKHGYADLPAHREKHLKMVGHVEKLGKQLQDGELTSPIQITNFLKDWLNKHILGTDMLYSEHLKQSGLS